MIIDPGILRKLSYQVWRKNICKVSLFGWNGYGGLINLQVDHLSLVERINIRIKTDKGSNMNYRDLIIWIKSFSSKFFLTNQFHLFSGGQNFGSGIKSLLEFSINEIALDIVQD